MRCHKQKRFNNRRNKKLPPSIKASKLLERRIIDLICDIYPVTNLTYEVVKASGTKSFSPVMQGQLQQFSELEQHPTCFDFNSIEGWETSITRKHLGLAKNKNDKSKQEPETHANDGIALAASNFIKYKKFVTAETHGYIWEGSVNITPAVFKVIAKPLLFRRQLHFENPVSGIPNNRKRKGGTVTAFSFRSGDLVQVKRKGKVICGWVGGYSNTAKSKTVSIYNHNWKRLGQFNPRNVEFLRRNTGLCVCI